MRFAGRVVLITGAARGQRRSHAVAFAREGAESVRCLAVPGGAADMLARRSGRVVAISSMAGRRA